MHLSRALSALLAASVLSACASSAAAPSRKPARTPVPEATFVPAPKLTDAQIARRSLLRKGDFPARWKAGRSPGNTIKCKATTTARKAASARALGKTFTMSVNTEVQSLSYVYRDEQTAKRQSNRLSGSGMTNCMVSQIKRVFAAAPKFHIGTITTAALDIGDVGDDRSATRITFPVTTKGAHGNVVMDLVVVRVGRTFALELFVDAYNQFDAGFREKLTDTHVRRLRDAQRH